MKCLSILIPCYNEEEVFPHLKSRLVDFCEKLPEDLDYEILMVDDGSRDLTWPLILDWADVDPKVKGISLSRNFGHQQALSCAYENCTGDIAVSIDADLQDPPEVISEMIGKWRKGANIVFAVRERREAETVFKRLTANWYYRLLKLLGMSYVEKDCGDFRLMDRKSLDALNRMPERNRLLRAMVGWTGFKCDRVRFVRPGRVAGQTKYPLRKMLLLATDGIISFSNMPLRFAYMCAFLMFFIVLVYVVITFVRYCTGSAVLVPGWTSLFLGMSLFGAANLLCTGIIGEYVGRIYSEVKQRPIYIVRSTTSDSH